MQRRVENGISEPISYHELGAGSPLLLIHGGFANGLSTWGAQMKLLPARHRLLVVDRRGHGASPREPRPYTIDGDATDVLEVADLADAGTFHLVGHSYGGLVAIALARRVPDRIRSIHLIEPPYLLLLPDDPDVLPMIEQGQQIFQHAGAWGPERTATAFFEMILGASGFAELRAHPAWPALVREASRTADEEFPTAYPPAALDDLRLTVPVTVYTGGRSHPGLRKLARQLVALIPGSRLVEVAEATHVVQRFVEPFHRALLAVTDAGSDIV